MSELSTLNGKNKDCHGVRMPNWICETRRPIPRLFPQEGSEDIPFIKLIRNVLMREALAWLSSVLVFLCRPGLEIGEVVTDLGLLIYTRMLGP